MVGELSPCLPEIAMPSVGETVGVVVQAVPNSAAAAARPSRSRRRGPRSAASMWIAKRCVT